MAQTAAGLQQNISSLEEKNRSIQAQWDSSNAAAKAEAQRWTGLQGYYDEQKSNVTNIHQQLHTALAETEGITPDEITASNGRVYVTLDDQVFSGGQLSSKGRKAIADFAGVLKDKQDLVVDVASANSYAAYWSGGTPASTMGSTDASTSSTDANANANANSNSTASPSTSSDNATAATDNTSSRPTARTTTTTRKSTTTVRRSSTATRSSRATASKSSSKSTARKSESGRKMSFKSGSSKTNNSWNSNIAKATAIAKELHKNGIYNVGLLVPGSENTTDAGTTTGKKNFQLIVSPKGDRYYQMIESNSPKTTTPATPGTQGTGTGTGTGGGQ